MAKFTLHNESGDFMNDTARTLKQRDMKNIKRFCKEYKMKFEKQTEFGFIASILVDVKSGMELDLHTGKLISIPIKKIGTRRVYFDMHTYSDGDISFGKQYKNSHHALKYL